MTEKSAFSKGVCSRSIEFFDKNRSYTREGKTCMRGYPRDIRVKKDNVYCSAQCRVIVNLVHYCRNAYNTI